MEATATNPDEINMNKQNIHLPFQRPFRFIAENPWILHLAFILTLIGFLWAMSGWHGVNYEVIPSIEAMGNISSHYLRFSNGSNELYHSMSVFEKTSISLTAWSEVHQTAIELDAELGIPNGKAISKMWNEMMDDVSLVMSSSQELNARAKWDLHVIFVEYKVIARSKMSSGVDYENLVSKIFRVLQILCVNLEDLEEMLRRAMRSKAAVHSSLYSTKKRLDLDLEERGLTQWLISHFRGNRPFLRHQQELTLARVAIHRTIEVSAYLDKLEITLKLYKDNINIVQDSIRVEQAQGCQKIRVPICLVFVESIFNSLH